MRLHLFFPLRSFTGKEDEFPKKPLGQLPPEIAVANHVANGQSHAEPAEPPREPSPLPDPQRDGRPPSRAHRESLEKRIRHHKGDKRETHSRGSGDISNETQKQSTSTTPERGATPLSAPTPTPQMTAVDGGKAHAIANHNSNAASSSRRDMPGPRWVKPSETKLEALREIQMSRGPSPAPSSPDDTAQPHRRPRSKGFAPGTDRGSNASQYDNVPGLPEQDFEILELEKPPSRLRPFRNEIPYNVSALHQGSPSHGSSLSGSVVSMAPGPRMARQPLPPRFPHNSPVNVPTGYPDPKNQFHTPPHQHSPGRTTTEVPIPHPTQSVDNRLYALPSRYPAPPSALYGERAYATTQRQPNSFSPDKTLMNNTFATYRRQPTHSSARNPRNPRPPPELDNQGSSTPIYLQQLTSTAQVYRFEGHQRGEPNPHYLPAQQGVDGLQWEPTEELPPTSPGGMPRSPSFQKAQMSPLAEFTFPDNPDALRQYRPQLQEQQQHQRPVLRQQLPQLFGGPHYRHAQEAFAMQESMLL